jgi:hypothetical protein
VEDCKRNLGEKMQQVVLSSESPRPPGQLLWIPTDTQLLQEKGEAHRYCGKKIQCGHRMGERCLPRAPDLFILSTYGKSSVVSVLDMERN